MLWKGYAAPRNTIVASKIWNDFFSPASITTTGVNGAAGEYIYILYPEIEFEYHMQIGSKLYPEYPIKFHAEAYYQLRKTLGHQSSTVGKCQTSKRWS